jgi:glycosyltransferase involved in cell wall biosynthesis
VRGYVDHTRLGELFDGASLFVHTSPAEGFPNTLLEAWAHGIPGITAVDPGGAVSRERLGEVVSDADGFLRTVERWMGDPAMRREAGARARAYVREHHAPQATLGRLADLLDRVVADVRERRRG